MMKRYILAGLVSVVMAGCTVNQYKLDPNLQTNRHTQVIVNDFMDYLRSIYKRGTWFKIDGGDGNKYIAKLRSTAIRKGLKVCINKCPENAITFETLIERIDGNLLEATLTTPKSVFHRIYKIDRRHNIRRFGNKTVYKR